MRETYQLAFPYRPCWKRRPALRGRETHLPILLDEVVGHMRGEVRRPGVT
jgi:hypothetical protein